MHWVEKLILTVSPENVAKHFRNFLELYVKPFKVYKKAISIRRNSLNYTILNVYYYGIFFFFIVGSALTVLKAIGLELILTLIPFLIFIIPFLVVKKIVPLKIKSNRLFRLLLLVKIQLVPIFIILLLSARTIDNRLLYIAIENLIYVIWIAWMIIPPIVIAKLAKHKLFWILTNYLFFLLFILIFSFLAESFSDSKSKYNKLISFSPNLEYIGFKLQYNETDKFLIDSLFLGVIEVADSDKIVLHKTQFVTDEVYISINKRIQNIAKSNLILIDSVRGLIDTNHISQKQEYGEYEEFPENELVSLQNLDALRIRTNELFYADMELAKIYLDSTNYSRNKEYYYSLLKYLKKYNETYINSKLMHRILSEAEIVSSIKLKDDRILILVKIDTILYEPERSNYLALESKFENEFDNSNIISNILFKPLDLIYDKLLY